MVQARARGAVLLSAGAIAFTTLAAGGDPGEPPTAVLVVRAIGTNSFRFDGSMSTDPDDDIVSYEWEFDDGQTGSGRRVEHAYEAPGPRTARLTVTDSGGRSSSAEQDISARLEVSEVVVDPAEPVVEEGVALTVRVRNEGTQTVTGLTPSVTNVTPAGALGGWWGPVPASASVLPGNSVDFVYATAALLAGDVSVTVSASGVAGSSGPVSALPLGHALTIAPWRLAVELSPERPDPARGEEFDVRATVRNVGPTAVGVVEPDPPLSIVPSERVTVTGPTPPRIAVLGGGAAATLTYRVAIGNAGDHELRLRVGGTEQATGRARYSPTASLTVQSSAPPGSPGGPGGPVVSSAEAGPSTRGPAPASRRPASAASILGGLLRRGSNALPEIDGVDDVSGGGLVAPAPAGPGDAGTWAWFSGLIAVGGAAGLLYDSLRRRFGDV